MAHERRQLETTLPPAQKRFSAQTEAPTWTLPIRSIPASAEHYIAVQSSPKGDQVTTAHDGILSDRNGDLGGDGSEESEFEGFGDVEEVQGGLDDRVFSTISSPNKISESEGEGAAPDWSTQVQCGRQTQKKPEPETHGEKQKRQMREAARTYWQKDLVIALDRDILSSMHIKKAEHFSRRLAEELTKLIPYDTPAAINRLLRAEMVSGRKPRINWMMVNKVRRDLVSQGKEPMQLPEDAWSRVPG